MEIFENLFTESGSDVTYGFVGIAVGIVTSEEEGSIDGSAFTTAIIGS